MKIVGQISEQERRRLIHRIKTAAAAKDIEACSVLKALSAGWQLSVSSDSWEWDGPDAPDPTSYARAAGSQTPPSPI